MSKVVGRMRIGRTALLNFGAVTALLGCTSVVVGRSDAGMVVDSPSSLDIPSQSDVTAESVIDEGGSIDSAFPTTCPAGTSLIPAGAFVMGDPDPSTPYAQPPHRVTITRAFCLDVTEVTVGAYGLCVGRGCTEPTADRDCNWMRDRTTHPINCVDWDQARDYCHSVGGELPTEAQWEFAARGTDGRRYPWGNEEPTSRLCSDHQGMPGVTTCPVGSFPASLHGLFDMEGNVDEWTLDGFSAYEAAEAVDPLSPWTDSRRTRRGMASWASAPPVLVRVATRFPGDENRSQPVTGFRCVRPPI